MTNPEISFYEVTNENFDKVVCQLIEKCYLLGKKTLVKTDDEGTQELLNKYLWTFSQKSFISHGSIIDPEVAIQPVLLSHKSENLNGASILLSVSSDYGDISSFERVIIVFYENSLLQKENARKLYTKYKKEFGTLTYYKQNPEGAWEKRG